MSQSISRMLFETSKLLAYRLAKKDSFFEKTACMDLETRELIAYCEMYKILFPEDKTFNEFLDKVIIPAFQRLGNARWLRTEITDLGLKVGTETCEIDLSGLENDNTES